MKKIYTFITIMILALSANAQLPNKFSYQAVIRDTDNNLLSDQSIGMQISILQNSASGTAVYVETQTPLSNANGLISIEIGAGNVQSGSFSSIDWSSGIYFLKTETDPEGGSNYTIVGLSQLLSVPYALHSKSADTLIGSIVEIDPVFEASPAVDVSAVDIYNLGNLSGVNTGDQDISGIDTNRIAIQDTAAQIRADIPDVSGFIITETDPIYASDSGLLITGVQEWNASLAKTITATDTIYWGADASSTNELQVLSISNDTIYLSNGGFAKLPPENDPVYAADSAFLMNGVEDWNASVAKGISSGDTAYWNNKSDTMIAGANIQISGDTIINTMKTYQVGDFAHGGVVFYVDETGQHGLVCAKMDQNGGNTIQWYNGSYTWIGAHGDGVYAGEMNTMLIVANQGSSPMNYAAGVCAVYNVEESGVRYGDWYLPSRSEMSLIHQNRGIINSTALANGGNLLSVYGYWTSTEDDNNNAWIFYMPYGGSVWLRDKRLGEDIRAVRAF